MANLCEHCGSEAGTIYCETNAMRLCIFCDHAIHAADEVSRTHARAPVCDHCHTQAAVIGYLSEHLTLCASCDSRRVSCSSIPASGRQPVTSYIGCSWVQAWASLLGTPDDSAIQFPSPEVAGLGSALETADNRYSPSESFAAWDNPPPVGTGGLVGDLEHSFETSIGYTVSASSWMLPPPSSSTDLRPLLRNLASELHHNHPEASTPAQNCLNFQSANNLQPLNNAMQTVNAYPRFPSTNYYSGRPISQTVNAQPTIPLPQLNLTRGSSSIDSRRRELSSVQLTSCESNWGLDVVSRKTNRETAIKRYLEKRNRRSFVDHIKYPLRKARAESRKRVNGRFVKEGETCTGDLPPTPPGETPEPEYQMHDE